MSKQPGESTADVLRVLAPSIRISLVGAMLLAGFGLASIPLTHWLQRTAGWERTPPIEEAWLNNPTQIERGVAQGTPFSFTIQFGGATSLHWSERSSGRLIASGQVSGAPGTEAVEIGATSAATPGTWLTISVSNLHHALRVWVLP